MVAALDALAQDEHWTKQFTCFPDFVFAPVPTGLGVRTIKALKLLRHALLEGGYIAEWTEVLESTTRKRGRPANNVLDENSRPIYRVTSATTGTDRILLRLKSRHPEIFAAVCESTYKIKEGGIRAGFIKAKSPTYGGAFDGARFSELSCAAQAKVLCEAFRKSKTDAQCTLIARHLEPHLGTDLAHFWREGAVNTGGA
jgi:hypothetical protein